MSFTVGGSTPQLTFADATVQNTAFTGLNQSATPFTTSLGYQALNSNTGANNTAVGYQAGYTNSLGGNNTFIGYLAGYTSNYNGTAANTCIGVAAGYSLTTGVGNCFIGGGSGGNSGYAVTTGSKNTIIGSYTGNQGGLDIRTASNYIVLSDGDGNPAAYRSNVGLWTFGIGGTTASSYEGIISLNAANTTGRGPGIQGITNGTNNWYLGAYSYAVGGAANGFFAVANSGGGGVYLNGASATSWTAVSSDARQKKDFAPVEGLSAVMQVVPTKFRYEWETESDPIHMGFTAQNLLPIIPDMVVIKEELHEDGSPLMTITPDYMLPILVKAIQELAAQVTTLQTQVTALKG